MRIRVCMRVRVGGCPGCARVRGLRRLREGLGAAFRLPPCAANSVLAIGPQTQRRIQSALPWPRLAPLEPAAAGLVPEAGGAGERGGGDGVGGLMRLGLMADRYQVEAVQGAVKEAEVRLLTV